jgi:hypothetical protein
MPMRSTKKAEEIFFVDKFYSSYFINVPDERGNSSIIFILLNTITQS